MPLDEQVEKNEKKAWYINNMLKLKTNNNIFNIFWCFPSKWKKLTFEGKWEESNQDWENRKHFKNRDFFKTIAYISPHLALPIAELIFICINNISSTITNRLTHLSPSLFPSIWFLISGISWGIRTCAPRLQDLSLETLFLLLGASL